MDVPSVVTACAGAALVGAVIWGIVRFATGRERPHRDGDGTASGMFGEIVEIFQPSRIHTTQERARQQSDIVQRPTHGLPFGVDLDGGVAYLPGTDPGPGPADPGEPGAGDPDRAPGTPGR